MVWVETIVGYKGQDYSRIKDLWVKGCKAGFLEIGVRVWGAGGFRGNLFDRSTTVLEF